MKSMTGFGRAAFEVSGRRYRIELRAVNSRFLDLKLRHPWNDAALDHLVMKRLKGVLTRGRVDVGVFEEGVTADGAALVLDLNLAAQLARAVEELGELLGGDRAAAARLLTPPRELLMASAPPADDLQRALLTAVDHALEALVAMRQREGGGLQRDLQQHLAHLEQLSVDIAARAEVEPLRVRRRLEQRVAQLELAKGCDDARMAQEIALVAERSDVSEELARLTIHAGQLRQMLESVEPIGRKLEFMLQELNREVNTIASKTGDAEAGTLVVEAKATLEKMREQVQNVE
ncbi:MAG: YicC family protein [Proteobacteria bacterium]|nr:MAG: YicC family protein [Pseudomonadota bacterium]PIE19324.1 MAG: YicC family protein [Pseudomonadota bacterium]